MADALNEIYLITSDDEIERLKSAVGIYTEKKLEL